MPLPAFIANGDGDASTNKQMQSSSIPLHTQTLLEQLSSFANPPAETSTTMEKDMTASSPPLKAPASPSLADHTSDSNDLPSLVDPSKTKSGVDSKHSDAGSAGTSPGDTAANVLEVPDENAAARSNKRARTDLPDKEDSLPSPKRVSKGSTPDLKSAGMTAPADTDDGPETATNDNEDNASVVAEPKKQKQKSRKAPTKKTTTTKAGRSRACVTCKRRKVKCTHNTTNEDATVEEGGVSKPQAPAPAEPAPEDDTAAHDMPTEDQPPKKSNARKRPAPKEPTAPPKRVSTRSCKPPRLEDPQPTVPPKRTSTRPSSPSPQLTTTPTKKPARRVFDPTYITTNSTSRLAKADIYHLLTDDASAWTCLTPAQQTTLISMLPSTPENQRLLERIRAGETQDTPPRYLSKGDVFRTEVAKFKEDLRNGHLAKTWQRDARVAVEERAEGVFDGWKGREAEAWWGQKSG